MKTTSNQNKLMKILTTPIRVLKKGKDMYIRSMMDYAQKPRYANSTMMGSAANKEQPPAGVSGLPKSFSTSVASSRSTSTFTYENEDMRELIRANSTSHNNDKVGLDVESVIKQLLKEQELRQELLVKTKSSRGSMPRSCSVGLGRIEEGKAFDLELLEEQEEQEEEEDEEEDTAAHSGVKKTENMFPRSKSHAVGQTKSLVY